MSTPAPNSIAQIPMATAISDDQTVDLPQTTLGESRDNNHLMFTNNNNTNGPQQSSTIIATSNPTLNDRASIQSEAHARLEKEHDVITNGNNNANTNPSTENNNNNNNNSTEQQQQIIPSPSSPGPAASASGLNPGLFRPQVVQQITTFLQTIFSSNTTTLTLPFQNTPQVTLSSTSNNPNSSNNDPNSLTFGMTTHNDSSTTTAMDVLASQQQQQAPIILEKNPTSISLSNPPNFQRKRRRIPTTLNNSTPPLNTKDDTTAPLHPATTPYIANNIDIVKVLLFLEQKGCFSAEIVEGFCRVVPQHFLIPILLRAVNGGFVISQYCYCYLLLLQRKKDLFLFQKKFELKQQYKKNLEKFHGDKHLAKLALPLNLINNNSASLHGHNDANLVNEQDLLVLEYELKNLQSKTDVLYVNPQDNKVYKLFNNTIGGAGNNGGFERELDSVAANNNKNGVDTKLKVVLAMLSLMTISCTALSTLNYFNNKNGNHNNINNKDDIDSILYDEIKFKQFMKEYNNNQQNQQNQNNNNTQQDGNNNNNNNTSIPSTTFIDPFFGPSIQMNNNISTINPTDPAYQVKYQELLYQQQFQQQNGNNNNNGNYMLTHTNNNNNNLKKSSIYELQDISTSPLYPIQPQNAQELLDSQPITSKSFNFLLKKINTIQNLVEKISTKTLPALDQHIATIESNQKQQLVLHNPSSSTTTTLDSINENDSNINNSSSSILVKIEKLNQNVEYIQQTLLHHTSISGAQQDIYAVREMEYDELVENDKAILAKLQDVVSLVKILSIKVTNAITNTSTGNTTSSQPTAISTTSTTNNNDGLNKSDGGDVIISDNINDINNNNSNNNNNIQLAEDYLISNLLNAGQSEQEVAANKSLESAIGGALGLLTALDDTINAAVEEQQNKQKQQQQQEENKNEQKEGKEKENNLSQDNNNNNDQKNDTNTNNNNEIVKNEQQQQQQQDKSNNKINDANQNDNNNNNNNTNTSTDVDIVNNSTALPSSSSTTLSSASQHIPQYTFVPQNSNNNNNTNINKNDTITITTEQQQQEQQQAKDLSYMNKLNDLLNMPITSPSSSSPHPQQVEQEPLKQDNNENTTTTNNNNQITTTTTIPILQSLQQQYETTSSTPFQQQQQEEKEQTKDNYYYCQNCCENKINFENNILSIQEQIKARFYLTTFPIDKNIMITNYQQQQQQDNNTNHELISKNFDIFIQLLKTLKMYLFNLLKTPTQQTRRVLTLGNPTLQQIHSDNILKYMMCVVGYVFDTKQAVIQLECNCINNNNEEEQHTTNNNTCQCKCVEAKQKDNELWKNGIKNAKDCYINSNTIDTFSCTCGTLYKVKAMIDLIDIMLPKTF